MQRLRREARRVTRLVQLLAHLISGLFQARCYFPWIELTGRDRDHSLRRTMIRAWMRRLLDILNVRLRVHGAVRRGAVLYCANHVSWLDIPCLGAVVDASFVAKSEVRGWPLIGGMATHAGTIFIARGARGGAMHVAERLTWWLAAGRSVLVFPEGTSTDGTQVLRFHARLYQAATRVHGHVQAVALRYPGTDGVNRAVPFIGNDNLISHLWRLLGEDRIEAELHFCDALTAYNRERRALAEVTRDQIVARLERREHSANAATSPNIHWHFTRPS